MGSIVEISRRLLTVDDYHKMGAAGVFAPEERVELFEGELIEMAPIGSAHGGTVNFLTRALVIALGERAIVQVQNPIRLGRHTEVQPDLTVLRPRPDFYRDATAEAQDVLLVVEVAQSSLDYDRNRKAPLYAAHGIPELWLVDLSNRLFTVFRTPVDDRYQSIQATGTPGRIQLSKVPDVTLDLEGLL